MAADDTATILISGGTLTVSAGGDGLDSNGTLTVTGGTVYVEGPTDSGNGALDYGSSASISGGTVVAVGSVGMERLLCFILLLLYQSLSTGLHRPQSENPGAAPAQPRDFARPYRPGLGAYSTVSTLIVLVLPDLPLIWPPVTTTLSPGCRAKVLAAASTA